MQLLFLTLIVFLSLDFAFLYVMSSMFNKQIIAVQGSPVVFNDSRDVGTHLVAGTPVLMNLSDSSEQERKRIIDFASGITFALGGTIERVTPKVFLLTPPGVELQS